MGYWKNKKLDEDEQDNSLEGPFYSNTAGFPKEDRDAVLQVMSWMSDPDFYNNEDVGYHNLKASDL
jgi:hypothetical protein